MNKAADEGVEMRVGAEWVTPNDEEKWVRPARFGVVVLSAPYSLNPNPLEYLPMSHREGDTHANASQEKNSRVVSDGAV